jgi:hypothetical protein
MPAGLQQSGLNYRYTILDMHTVDCQKLIAMDDPDALVLAILCDFKDRPEQEVVHYKVNCATAQERVPWGIF